MRLGPLVALATIILFSCRKDTANSTPSFEYTYNRVKYQFNPGPSIYINITKVTRGNFSGIWHQYAIQGGDSNYSNISQLSIIADTLITGQTYSSSGNCFIDSYIHDIPTIPITITYYSKSVMSGSFSGIFNSGINGKIDTISNGTFRNIPVNYF
jgi:hypothetical protein